MVMRISRVLLDRLIAETVSAPDREICGLLLGNAGEILDATPAANVSANPHDSFEIDPQTLFEQARASRAGGPAWIGHYHSHPRGVAEPSARDREAARGTPVQFWLILAGRDAALWRLGDDPNGFAICQRVELVA